jgi:hypothetical protein
MIYLGQEISNTATQKQITKPKGLNEKENEL